MTALASVRMTPPVGYVDHCLNGNSLKIYVMLGESCSRGIKNVGEKPSPSTTLASLEPFKGMCSELRVHAKA